MYNYIFKRNVAKEFDLQRITKLYFEFLVRYIILA